MPLKWYALFLEKVVKKILPGKALTSVMLIHGMARETVLSVDDGAFLLMDKNNKGSMLSSFIMSF